MPWYKALLSKFFSIPLKVFLYLLFIFSVDKTNKIKKIEDIIKNIFNFGLFTTKKIIKKIENR